MIINGKLTTTTEKSGKPTGSATLGLIATNYVRIYHPVQQTYKATGEAASKKSPVTESAKIEKSISEKAKENPLIIIEATLVNSKRYSPTTKNTARKKGTGTGGTKCEPTTEWEYISGLSGNEKCASKICTGEIYMTGEGKCAKCTGSDPYFASEKKCGNATCNNSNETYITGKYECASCPTGDLYIASEKKCETTSCNPNETYITGKYKCASCPSGDLYIASENQCATPFCNANETYITGKYECASCPTGDLYVASEKKCATTTCSTGYTYIGNYECKGCTNSNETYEPTKQECETCNSTNDTYAGEAKCKYENSASGCDAENAKASEDPDGWGYLENPIIDAAILSTAHSFIVDNFKCGKHLGELTVWGAIAQFWRGTVGTGGGSGGTGYTKNYNYDERLATLQPPDFLTPSSSTLKLSRITAPPG